MSKKYIECEAAKEQIRAHIIIGEPKTNVGLNLAIEAIDEVPAADVVEMRHGKWIWLEEEDDDFETDIVTCSYCGKSYETRFSKKSFFETFKFCHNCGAKMDGGQDNA